MHDKFLRFSNVPCFLCPPLPNTSWTFQMTKVMGSFALIVVTQIKLLSTTMLVVHTFESMRKNNKLLNYKDKEKHWAETLPFGDNMDGLFILKTNKYNK